MTRRLLFAFLLASLLLLAPTAQGASADLVISQVYAGGGNAGATYTNDFVEVFNRGSSTVDLTGWTIQYATATGTSWSPTALAGSLAPGRHYLVQLASAAAIGSALPTPDATGTTNLATSGGKVTVVHDTTALTCGASAGSCSAVATVHDLVGYGSALDYEGAAPADALDNASAAVRAGNGCTDTDSSAADFTTAAPAPRTTTAPAISCSGATGSGSQGAVVDIDVQTTLSISLEHATLSFGSAVVGQTPAPVGEKVTVTSTDAQGYTLMAHRSAFTPADLPLGVGSTAPAGGLVNALFGGGAFVALPVGAAADLLVGTTTAASAAGGDVWPTRLGFTSALPAVPPGHYSSTVTYTVIAR